MPIEQSFALMASAGVGGVPSDVLVSDDGRFEARAHALADESKMQMLGIGINHDLGASYYVYDTSGVYWRWLPRICCTGLKSWRRRI